MNLKAIRENTIKHIFIYSVPAIIAMVLSSLVPVVDGYFISNILGQEALASVNLGMPIMYIYLAIGIMIGVGGISLAGRRLGAGHHESSINGFNQTILTAVVVFFAMTIVSSLSMPVVIKNLGIALYTKQIINSYYGIMLWVYPFMMMNIIFGMFIRGEGKPHIFMINTVITTIMNIVLDYLFMSVFDLGVKGAAYSSALAVVTGTIMMVACFMSEKTLFKFTRPKFSKEDLYSTLTNGSSEFIGQISLSITMFFLNLVVLKRMGLMGVAAITIIGYSRFIYSMIVTGFGQGIAPMMSFSYGAKEYDLCARLRERTSRIVLVLGVAIFLILGLGGKYYASIFTQDTELIQMLVYGLRIFSFAFIAIGVNVIASFYFTSMGYAKESAIISALRGLILLLFNIAVLPLIFGDTGIWLIGPVTEFGTLVVTLSFLRKGRAGKNMV